MPNEPLAPEPRDPVADPMAAHEQEYARRRRHTCRTVIGALVLPLLVALALLPQIASLPPVRTRLLEQVNARLAPRELAVASWRLRWWGPLDFRGIRATDPNLGWDVTATETTVSRGLLRLLPIGRLDLGEITVQSPQIALRLPDLRRAERAMPTAEPPPRVSPPSQPRRPVRLPVADLAFTLKVTNGRLQALAADGTELSLAGLRAAVALTSLTAPLTAGAEFQVQSPAGHGEVSVALTLDRPAAVLAGEPGGLAANLRLNVTDVDLTPVNALVGARLQGWRVGAGRLDTALDMRLDWPRQVASETEVSVTGLVLQPPDASAAPMPPADLRLAVRLAYADGHLTVHEGALRSPWLTATADGRFAPAASGGVPTGQIQAEVRVNLPEAMRDFGPLLGLQQGVGVDSGRVLTQVAVAGDASGLRLQASLQSTNLVLRSAGKRLAIEPPPTLSLRASRPHGRPLEVEAFDLHASFAQVSGAGSYTHAQVVGYVDLTALSRDFGKVLRRLPPMVGRVDLKGQLDRAADTVRAGVQLTAVDVAVALAPERRLVLEQASLAAAADLPLHDGQMTPVLENLTWGFAGSPGTVSGRCARVAWPVGTNAQPFSVRGAEVQCDLDLARTARVAAPWVKLPARTLPSGQLLAGLTCEGGAGVFKTRYQAALRRVLWETSTWKIDEPHARLSGTAEMVPTERRLRLAGVEGHASMGSLRVPEWVLMMPAGKGVPVFHGNAEGSLDLAALHAWRKPPRDTAKQDIRGTLEFRTAAASAKDGTDLDLSVTATDLSRISPGRRPWVEPRASVALDLFVARDGQAVTLRKLELRSSLLGLEAEGAVADLQKQVRAKLAGQMALDFGQLDRLLRAEGVRYPAVSGRASRPFDLQAPLAAGPAAVFAYGRGQAAWHIESLAAFGLSAGPADLKVALADGVLKIEYAPPLNAGRARLLADLALTAKPWVVTVPRETRVLDKVQLTDEMLREVLGYVNPLLRECGAAGGQISLTCSTLHLPLDQSLKKATDFRAQLELIDIELEPAGVLAEILAMAGVSDQKVKLAHELIDVTCTDGRVRPGTQRATIKGYPITFSGTVGLDGSVAYRVEMPLTEEVVGQEAWKHLKGMRVTIPVTGTLDRPAIDRNALKSEIRRLVGEAAQQALTERAGDLLDKLRERVTR